MPSNYTPNYQLSQWEAEDQVSRLDFNADNAKIDAAIADAKPKFAVGTYTGTGQAGPEHPNVLTFDFEPQVVLAVSNKFAYPFMAIMPRGSAVVPVIRTQGAAYGPVHFMYVSWVGNTVSWYVNGASDDHLTNATQGSVLDQPYCYIAIG